MIQRYFHKIENSFFYYQMCFPIIFVLKNKKTIIENNYQIGT